MGSLAEYKYIIPCPSVTSAKYFRKKLRSKQRWKGLCKFYHNTVAFNFVDPRRLTQDLSLYTGKFVYPYTRDYLPSEFDTFNSVLCNRINAHQVYYKAVKSNSSSLYTDISKDPRVTLDVCALLYNHPIYINKYDVNLDDRALVVKFMNSEKIVTSLEDISVLYDTYQKDPVKLIQGNNVTLRYYLVTVPLRVKNLDCNKLIIYSPASSVTFDYVKIRKGLSYQKNYVTVHIKNLDLSEYQNQFFFPELGESKFKIDKFINPHNILYYIDDKQNNIPDDYFKDKKIVFSTNMLTHGETWRISNEFLSNKGIFRQTQVTESTDFFVYSIKSIETDIHFIEARDCGTKMLDIHDFAKLCKTQVYL